MRMDDREALLTLAHQLGDPSKALAVSAEGNVSARLGEDTMSIKASGCSMASMTVQDLVDDHDVDVDPPSAAQRAPRRASQAPPPGSSRPPLRERRPWTQ